MASSNRHWPSLFKSKPTPHQWHHDINSSLISSPSCIRPPYAPGQGCEERTPEPKPRWNPRPEQIRILEAIFNSGMVNPPRDEIRRIRAQLQEFGQVGDANVFYWFQNRKSRSKHKQRQLHSSKTRMQPAAAPAPPPAAPSPSSSSSDKSSHNNSSEKSLSVGHTTVIDLLNSPTASVNQPFLYPSADFLVEPFLFPVKQNSEGEGLPPSANMIPQELCFSNVEDQNQSFLLSDLMLMKEGEEGMKLQQQFSYGGATAVIPTVNTIVPPSLSVPSLTADQLLQGSGPTKSTVFINDVCFDVSVGPFNVREAFGDDAVLFLSSGQPVLTDEWGVTVQPLQDGGSYYLLRPFTPSPHEKQTTIHHLI